MAIKKINLNSEDYDSLIFENGNIFNSTMLDIFGHRSNNVSPSALLKNYKSKHNLYEPSKLDPRVYNEINNVFFDTVSGDFECIELSPICPFGLNTSLTNTNQNNVLSSVRNSEVISDSSISMALECAYRIKELNTSPINLASSTRLLRTQNYGNGKKSHWSQHFRACSLVSSFRNVENNMINSLLIQLDNWLNVIENMKGNLDIEKISLNLCYIPLIKEIYTTHGININDILSNTVNPNFDIFQNNNIDLPKVINNESDIESIKSTRDYLLTIRNAYNYFYKNILCILKENHQNVNFNLHLNRKSGLTYYDDVCYEIEVQFKNGKSLVLVDGGINNWIGKILSDAKEKCVTSGMGLEYIGKVYKKKI